MTDPIVTQPNWINIILGVFMALLAWIGKIGWNKIDRLEDTYVSREDLERYMDQMREDRIEMHQENSGRLERLADDMNRVHDRIDQVLRQ
jgi:cell division protein FtsB